MSSRENILRRLRSSTAAAHLPAMARPAALAPQSASVESCLARFSVEAAALGVDCFVENTAADVQRRVAELTCGRTILRWGTDHLPYAIADVLPSALSARATRAEQAAAHIGVTACDAAIAETASLVMFSGPGRSRAVSLLPPVHLAIVERSRLYFSMSEMLASHRQQLATAASCTLVTGPSRTADIELTLTLGIHGPAQVIVVIGP
jgi:L-lactate dehydrogenase complex protein LldG